MFEIIAITPFRRTTECKVLIDLAINRCSIVSLKPSPMYTLIADRVTATTTLYDVIGKGKLIKLKHSQKNTVLLFLCEFG